MTKYIRVSDMQYPLTEANIQELYPNKTFPIPFKATGYEVVFPTPKPSCETLQIVVEDTPVLTSKNTWAQTWKTIDRFQAITDGPTKAEQETAYLAELSTKAAEVIAEEAKQARKRKLAEGVVVDGMRFYTDDLGGIYLLDAACNRLIAGICQEPIRWKCMNGWADLTVENTPRIQKAVMEFIQACFDDEYATSVE